MSIVHPFPLNGPAAFPLRPCEHWSVLAARSVAQLDEAIIDEACRRILRLKFQLGLFDQNRYTDLAQDGEIIGCAEHRRVALESAYQSIVLLKNQDDLLPLDRDLKRIAVLGPNANDVVAQLGDWVFLDYPPGDEQVKERRASVVTVLDGIRDRVGVGCLADYCRGCDVIGTDTTYITAFAYSNLRLSTKRLLEGEEMQVWVDVKNVGERAGTEIVQLYVNDVYSSVTTPVKELKAFQRVGLQPGEKRRVQLDLPYERLSLIDRDQRAVVEPGTFEVMVGSSSRDGDLLKDVFEVVG